MKSCFKIDKNYNWKCWSFEVFFKWLQSLNEHTQNPQTTCYFIFILQCKIRKLLKIRKEYQSTGFIFDYCNYSSVQIKLQTVNIFTVNKCVNKLGVFYLYLGITMVEKTICNEIQWKWRRKQGVPAMHLMLHASSSNSWFLSATPT